MNSSFNIVICTRQSTRLHSQTTHTYTHAQLNVYMSYVHTHARKHFPSQICTKPRSFVYANMWKKIWIKIGNTIQNMISPKMIVLSNINFNSQKRSPIDYISSDICQAVFKNRPCGSLKKNQNGCSLLYTV